ncbi:MAG: type VII secretion target [Actinomycetota bacterium]|nr:type VII secretion target [Actinomycetota bacterium]
MAGSGFTATPEAITGLAEAFGSAAQELADAIDGFEATARDVGEGFGWLGPSEEIFHDYQRSVADAVEGLEGISGVLAAGGRQLAVTAANYQGSDDASTPAP